MGVMGEVGNPSDIPSLVIHQMQAEVVLIEVDPTVQAKRALLMNKLDMDNEAHVRVLDVFSLTDQFLLLNNEILSDLIPLIASNSNIKSDNDGLNEVRFRYMTLYKKEAE